MDLASAWRLARDHRLYAPEVVHAHDPHAVAMASLALSFGVGPPPRTLVASRRVDFHLQRHSFSRWKYRQVELLHRGLAGDRRHPGARRHSPRPASPWCTTASTSTRDRNAPAADLHAEFWFPKGAPVIVNVGALVPHKGQKFLVEAMAHVRRQVPDAQLVIFGEGELRGALEQQIRDLGLDKHVVLAGFRDDVLALTRSADLFVMSSVTEGLGSTVLDAMAMGLAVVGTRAGGIPEAVKDGVTGVLVPPGRMPRRWPTPWSCVLARPGAAQQMGAGRPRARARRVRGRPAGRGHARRVRRRHRSLGPPIGPRAIGRPGTGPQCPGGRRDVT